MIHLCRALLLLTALVAVVPPSRACTSTLVGKKASADGSVFASHSNDGGATTDPRLVRVPPKSYEAGAMRPVWFDHLAYPRYVGTLRGDIPAYRPDPSSKGNQTVSVPIGFVPQPKGSGTTYSYLEDTYGAQNEKQVGVGESTCSAIPWSKYGGKLSKTCKDPANKGKGCVLLSITELTRLAMERSNSSRMAVEVMGAMAEAHGFYGEDGFEGSGESLMVVDPQEGWIFHVLNHPSGTGAVWVAQRVPDDHVATVTNMFTIREVNLDDDDNYLGSDLAVVVKDIPTLRTHCMSNTKCNFVRTFSNGEYAHKYYSGRRMWGVYRLLTPGTALSPTYGNLKDDAPYPATVPVDSGATGHRVTLGDIMDAHRDHYEDTPFALTEGLAAGAFGNPNRNPGGKGEDEVEGNWERAISIQRTSDSYIVQARSWLPDEIGGVLWFGPHTPHATSYTPFPAGILDLPASFSAGNQGMLQKETAFWKIRYVAQAMILKFNYTRVDVSAAQSALYATSVAALHAQEELWVGGNGDRGSLTKAFKANADHFATVYGALFDHILFKYSDGWINEPTLGEGVGYPAMWLRDVGYPDGPPPIPNGGRNRLYDIK